MWKKIKNTFFTREFIIFCLIGVIAFIIHQGVYLLYTQVLNFYDDKFRLTSTAIAFSLASIVAYILNAKWTYNDTITKDKTIKAMLTYVAKFALTMGITLGIMAIANNNLDKDSILYKIIDLGLPVILTCITLVLQFLVFNLIFKKKDTNEEVNKNQE